MIAYLLISVHFCENKIPFVILKTGQILEIILPALKRYDFVTNRFLSPKREKVCRLCDCVGHNFEALNVV